MISIVTYIFLGLVLGSAAIPIGSIVGVALALAAGIGGTYGLIAKRKDEATAVWRGIAEAREAQNAMQAQDIALLKARVDLLTSEWSREMVRQIIQLVERERTEGRS